MMVLGRTVGVFRWVLDNTMSKKSAAVGTGAIAFRPLVDMVRPWIDGQCSKFVLRVSQRGKKKDKISHDATWLIHCESLGSISTTMASLIAILDLKGKPLIQRSYRDDVPPSYVERFLPLILDIEEEGQQVTPCFSSQGINFMHIRHSNLYRKFSLV